MIFYKDNVPMNEEFVFLNKVKQFNITFLFINKT